MNVFTKSIYTLSGVVPEVIQECPRSIKIKYFNLALALLLTGALAFVGGWDIAQNFTKNATIQIGVGCLWMISVISFDYFMLCSEKTSKFMLGIRMLVAFSNLMITLSALFILLNKDVIENRIMEKNGGKIEKLDKDYLDAKTARYAANEAKKAEIAKYHTEICVPQSKNGFPGPLYERNHSVCLNAKIEIAKEDTLLGKREAPFVAAYDAQKTVLTSESNSDFFSKVVYLPEVVFEKNWIVTFLAFCLFIFLGYIEMQAILMKFSIDKNDIYHVLLSKQNMDKERMAVEKIENESEIARLKQKYENEIKISNTNLEFAKKQKEMVDDIVVEEMRSKMTMNILKRKGYTDGAIAIAHILEMIARANFSNQQNTNTPTEPQVIDIEPVEEVKVDENIFVMTYKMKETVEEIKATENGKPLAEKLYDWVHENIEYDTKHNLHFYRDAKDCFNNKLGICGEQSILLKAFYNYVGIESNYLRITKDNKGENVKHACLGILNGKDLQMVDVTYHSFDLQPQHQEYEIVSTEQLHKDLSIWNV